MEIAGKVAIVTGAAQGIGRAITESLLKKGAGGVAIVDIDDQKGRDTAEELKQQYGADKVLFFNVDVTSKSHMEDVFRQTKIKFSRLDIYCNNAGIIDEFNFEEMVNVNFISTIRNTYLAVEYMGTKNGGHGGVIIITASAQGLSPGPFMPVYSATKHGLVGFARSVAHEPMVKDNSVRVAVICPGRVRTKLLLQGRRNRYEDIIKETIDKTAATLEPSVIGDHVITMIEDDKYNGCACLAATGYPFQIMEPPQIELK